MKILTCTLAVCIVLATLPSQAQRETTDRAESSAAFGEFELEPFIFTEISLPYRQSQYFRPGYNSLEAGSEILKGYKLVLSEVTIMRYVLESGWRPYLRIYVDEGMTQAIGGTYWPEDVFTLPAGAYYLVFSDDNYHFWNGGDHFLEYIIHLERLEFVAAPLTFGLIDIPFLDTPIDFTPWSGTINVADGQYLRGFSFNLSEDATLHFYGYNEALDHGPNMYISDREFDSSLENSQSYYLGIDGISLDFKAGVYFVGLGDEGFFWARGAYFATWLSVSVESDKPIVEMPTGPDFSEIVGTTASADHIEAEIGAMIYELRARLLALEITATVDNDDAMRIVNNNPLAWTFSEDMTHARFEYPAGLPESYVLSDNYLPAQVEILYSAQRPRFIVHPQGNEYEQGKPAAALSATATTDDGGTLTYVWYSSPTDSNEGGAQVGVGETYTPPVTTIGTAYYYVAVTNSNANATGAKTVSVASNTAAVTVTASSTINSACEGFDANPLRAWTHGGRLRVTGLAPGETMSVYTSTGALVYQTVVISEEAELPIAAQGIIIVRQGNKTVRVSSQQ